MCVCINTDRLAGQRIEIIWQSRLALSSELSVAAPTVARQGRQLAKVEFEFELDFVAVGGPTSLRIQHQRS